MDQQIVIVGIPIPRDDPLFLGTLAVHVPAGLVCVVVGLIAMLRTKRPGPHPEAGAVYYLSLLVVFITSTVLSVLRWDEDYHLFILGALSFAAASLGRIARRQQPPRLALHVMGMGASYVLLLTAFYVDNGKNLPLWQELPQWMFWVLPSAIGGPIIMYTLLRHPLLRQPRAVEAPSGEGT